MDTTPLLEHLDWVRALAHRLVTDQNVADDLIQEAWLAAERSAPIQPKAARGWFASVLRRKAAERYRVEGNRRDRESRVARSESAPSDAQLHGNLEVEAQVSRAVKGLDEPYRRTILLRYFEDMTPTEIAAAEGIPLNTVKSRLTRGHAALRQRLDDAHGSDGRTWILALIPIAKAPAAKTTAAWGTGSIVAMVAAGLIAAVGLVLGWMSQREPVTPADLDIARLNGPAALIDETPLIEVVLEKRATVRPGDALVATSPSQIRSETLVIRFVHHATKEPVPGAAAWVIDADQQTDPAFQIAYFARDRMDLFRRFGVRVVANGEGVASVAWSGMGATIAAVDGAWFGDQSVDARSASDVDLIVYPNAPLAVRVVDQQGEGVAGMRVGLMRRDTGRASVVGTTTTGGHVTIPYFGGLTGKARLLGTPSEYSVTLVYPGSAELSGVPVDLAADSAIAAEPVVVTRPSIGELKLVAPVDLGEPRAVWIQLHSSGELGVPSAAAARPERVPTHVVWFEGRDEARTVCALAKTFVATWSVDDEPRQMTFAGPSRPDESIEVRLRADTGGVEAAPPPRDAQDVGGEFVLKGRIVDADGKPYRRTKLKTRIQSDGRSSGASSITDKDGEFSLQQRALGSPVGDLRIYVNVQEHPRGAFAVLRPSASSLHGVVELGDVMVKPYRRLLSGSAVDDRGAPVEGARVDVDFEIESQDALDEVTNVYWRMSRDFSGRSLKDGSFEVFAPPLESLAGWSESMTGRIRGHATKNSLASERVLAVLGGAVELEMVQTADVALAFVGLTEGIASDLSAILVRPATGERRGHIVEGDVYRWLKVLPGIYELNLMHRQFEEPLLVLGGIEVTSVGCDDERLNGLDLRTLVTACMVRVEKSGGEPAQGVTVWVHREDGSSGARGTRTDERGEVTVLSRPGNPRRIRVGEIDWNEEPTLLLQDLVVQLPKALEIKVRLVSNEELTIGREILCVKATSTVDRRMRTVDPTGPADEDGWLTFELKGPGSYSFEWALMRASSRSTRNFYEGDPAGVVDVTEDGQSIELTVPAEVLHAARSKRRGGRAPQLSTRR